MSANGWTEADLPPVNPEWTEAHGRLAAAYAYRAGLHGFTDTGPNPAHARRLGWVDRIIEHREAALAEVRP